MTTKRTPIHRHSRTRITPDAVALFMTAEKHAARYSDCIAGRHCDHPNGRREHCAECRLFVEASGALDRALVLKPWEAGPLDVTGPSDFRDGTAWADSLGQAWELRQTLKAAAQAQQEQQP